MRLWTKLLSFVLVCAVAAGAAAQEKKKKDGAKKTRPTAKERFEKMDTDKNGTVTEKEFVTARMKSTHPMTEEAAKELFKKLGGTADKGLTLEQYEKAMKQYEKDRRKNKKDQKKPAEKPAT